MDRIQQRSSRQVPVWRPLPHATRSPRSKPNLQNTHPRAYSWQIRWYISCTSILDTKGGDKNLAGVPQTHILRKRNLRCLLDINTRGWMQWRRPLPRISSPASPAKRSNSTGPKVSWFQLLFSRESASAGFNPAQPHVGGKGREKGADARVVLGA